VSAFPTSHEACEEYVLGKFQFLLFGRAPLQNKIPEFDGSILFVGVGLFAAIFLLKKQKDFRCNPSRGV
jgi:hypothetical protein